jgi:hypothetical protein
MPKKENKIISFSIFEKIFKFFALLAIGLSFCLIYLNIHVVEEVSLYWTGYLLPTFTTYDITYHTIC